MYTHIHYIIETFSMVGSVPTPLNDLQKPLRHALYLAPQGLAVLHPQNPQPLGWLVWWDSCSCIFIHHRKFSIGLRSGLLPRLTGYCVKQSTYLQMCQTKNFHHKMVIFCPVQAGGPLWPRGHSLKSKGVAHTDALAPNLCVCCLQVKKKRKA
jgi:hypothetical protein